MPHPSPPRPRRHRHRSLDLDVERLAKRLEPWLPKKADRDFVLRCVLDEGPTHHRGSNYVLITLLAHLASLRNAKAPRPPFRPFEMRLPPHLEDEVEERHWPLELPERALELVGERDRSFMDALADCLTDGPPQHAVANVLMVQLLTSLIEQEEDAE